MMGETRTAVRPLRDLVYVERLRPKITPGGIHIPETFEAKHSARLKTAATPDYFPAKVLSVGPLVRELVPGDTVLVHTYAEGDGKTLYTGENVGERDRLLVRYPDDFVCATVHA
jgi:hypothetical protein